MITEELYTHYLNSLVDGKKATCVDTVQNLLGSDVNIVNLYEQLYKKSMYEIGLLWEKNEISVAIEHLATAITEFELGLAYPKIFSTERVGKRAIVACVVNEFHQLGGKMISDVFELHGWDAFFLGANTPVEDLLIMIDEKKPEIVALSVSIYFNIPRLENVIKKIRSKWPALHILVGGQAFRFGGGEILKKYMNVTLAQSLSEVEKIIEEGVR